ncbi:MAG: ATP-binding protein [Syntrophales bacterium]
MAGWTTGFLLDTELTDEQCHYAETVRFSGESLLSLLNDILDFSKIEAGKLALETLDFDLSNLLDDFAAMLAMRAHEKGLELLGDADPTVPTLLSGDAGRLRQILTNLAGNAIKFTPLGEVAVRVSLVEENEHDVLLRFSVRDTGIGIPADKIGLLFCKFSQVDASITRQYGGTGLGLAISKQLAEMMGGEVGVVSEEGKGSEFWFTVRLGKWVEGVQKKSPPPVDLQDVRVLIVDDNNTNREILTIRLTTWGMRPSEAQDGPEALKILSKTLEEDDPFPVAIIDMQMPVMDGIQASQQIRDPKSAVLNHDIPIIAMTAHAMQGDRERCMEAGMNDYVTKPVSPQALLEAMEKWLPKENDDGKKVGAGFKPAPTDREAVRRESVEPSPLIFDSPGMMARLMDDKDVALMLIDCFLEDIPKQLLALRGYLEADDATSAERQAHTIKGASANLGGEALRAVANEMEIAGKAGELKAAAARLPELERQFASLKEAMNEFVLRQAQDDREAVRGESVEP